MWAIFAGVAIIPWVALVVRERAARGADEDIETANPRVFGRLWRLPLVWALMATFTVSGTIAYTSFAWLPTLLIDTAGVTPAAGRRAPLALRGDGPAGIARRAAPRRALQRRARPRRRSPSCAASPGSPDSCSPRRRRPWLWVALLGIAPLLFPLTLVLLGLRARTHEGAVALSGFVQSFGYGIVALFPIGIGIVHGATDSWTLPAVDHPRG